jgi:hypothetical protein
MIQVGGREVSGARGTLHHSQGLLEDGFHRGYLTGGEDEKEGKA